MHSIGYLNTFSDWSEALPLGNGRFGALGWLDATEGLTLALNHYDVSYKMLPWHSECGRAEGIPRKIRPKMSVQEVSQRAAEAHADPNHPAHSNYNYVLQPDLVTAYGQNREGAENAIAAHLRITPCRELLKSGQSRTALQIEAARMVTELADGDGRQLQIRGHVAADCDVVVLECRQLKPGCIESLQLSVPLTRLFQVNPLRSGVREEVAFVENSFWPLGEDKAKYRPFRYAVALRVVGGRLAAVDQSAEQMRLKVEDDGREFSILATVVSGEEAEDVVATAIRRLNETATRLAQVRKRHAEYWEGFFNRSRVTLPDKLLESLWYLHLYSLGCCSGAGASIGHEACGLSGLWLAKSPTQWHSTWYWDVNIEQAFWPVFTSNHLELSEPFVRGLLSWVESARDMAWTYHGIEGIAPDYPHPFYLSIWPWCAQYFWWYYRYSLDEQFLREKALPLFRDILRFFQQYVKYDESGRLYVFPDVAPEQGPMCRNSMSTIASLKFLLRSAIEASRVLEEDPQERERWQAMLNRCPEYALASAPEFGAYYRDSEWASGLLFLAHSGTLKPIYPIRELTKRSDEQQRNRAIGTLRYVDTMQVFGTHNIWPAAAAAVLGLGDEAVRILYERGLALQMRANGMIAERTDRWMQNCCVNLRPAYHPPLIEGGSTIVATINEMLLQSYGGVIEVFPAIPRGQKTLLPPSSIQTRPLHQQPAPVKEWREVSFERLLAEGAFEVSAWMAEGEVRRVRILSRRGGEVCLVDPFAGADVRMIGGEFARADGQLRCMTTAGQTYELIRGEVSPKAQEDVVAAPMVFQAPSRRRVFLGKDRDTEYYRALDGATLDFYPGHSPQSKLTVYKFDFGKADLQKDYTRVLPVQWHVAQKQGPDFHRIATDSIYRYWNGRGWADASGLQHVDRGGPDELRRDFITSQTEAEFVLELCRGMYQMLMVIGDSAEAARTIVTVPGLMPWDSGVLRPGQFVTPSLPLFCDRDGVYRIRFASVEGMRWNVCAMILNEVL